MKYNIVYDKITISTDKELDEHLKRHLKQYMENKKPLPDIHKWITDKGYECEIRSST